MKLYPAIDIKDGRCVRLQQGRFDQVKVYYESPAEVAALWEEKGASFLHLVDLDGALKGRSANADCIRQIVETVKIPTELGGGIRSLRDIEEVLELGVYRAIIGTKAVEDPNMLHEAVKQFGAEHIAVGIDAKNGMVAVNGWEQVSQVSAMDLALQMKEMGVQTIIYTDISKDGMLSGVNGEQLDAINRAVSCGIIASGGVKSIADIELCKQLNLYGVICGKSIYSGSLNLAEAVAKAGAQKC